MRFPRSSGLLLHPTSLPGPHGLGDLGAEAHRLVDWLAAAGQGVWQVLPLGPTGYGDSPYQCLSAHAGNPLLVSAASLAADGLMDEPARARLPRHAEGTAAYAEVAAWKPALLAHAAERFLAGAHPLRGEFDAFAARHAAWLDDWALYAALKRAHAGRAWNEWPEPLRRRDAAALAEARRAQAAAVDAERFAQWAFDRQWAALRAAARARGVALFGDAPIFVAHDSADVWARPDLFRLDAAGRPEVVAGVPPDYFSATGQRWGNPLYRWEAMAADDYAWWSARLGGLLARVDRVRLDHFIGFVRHWEVPAGAADARAGRWQPGPGEALFAALARAHGALPLVAEDLGETGPDVEALRDRLELPGMAVLQFAFGSGAANAFLPHRLVPNRVIYTGTHDNDTTCGWWAQADAPLRAFARAYLGPTSGSIAWDLLRLAQGSVADTCVAPVQDALGLGTEARLNHPGRAAGNWSWRLEPGQLDGALAERLRALAETYGRTSPPAP